MSCRPDTSTRLLPCYSYLQINVAEKKSFKIPKQNQHYLKNSTKMYYARDSAMRRFQATIQSTSNAIENSTTSWKSRAFMIFVLIWDLGMCMGNANKKFKRHDQKKRSTNRRETSQPTLPSLQKKQKQMQFEEKFNFTNDHSVDQNPIRTKFLSSPRHSINRTETKNFRIW